MILGALVIGPAVTRLVGDLRAPTLLAFSTASSGRPPTPHPRAAAALRRLQAHRQLRAAARLLVQPRRLDDVLHLRDPVHRAQAYGIDLSWGQKITMLLLLMVTSRAWPACHASLVVIAATLTQFNIPEAGLLLILAVDHFLDRGTQRDQRDQEFHRGGGGREVGG